MSLPAIIVIVLLLGLGAGLACGWFFGSRPAADWRARFEARDGEARELDGRFRQAIGELATMSERAARADALAGDLDRTREEREGLRAELATLKANAAHFEEQKQGLLAVREQLLKEFRLTGSEVLGKAQEEFLKNAAERFGQTEKTNEARIKAVLDPIGQHLEAYRKQVLELESKRIDDFGSLRSQIEEMRKGQDAVRAEAVRLGHSLRNAPKARGRWGEQQLRNVLEQCGLSEHTDFITEHSIDTEEGRLRPDAIVRIPGNKQLVIDSKVALNDYQDAFDADDEVSRQSFLDKHAVAMRNHVQSLAAKSYQSQFENAPDYVLMFVPGEHFITAAMEKDNKLWDYAFERRVLIASPTNLVAIARTIAQVWQQEGLAKEAREIGKLASDLYDSLAKTQDDLLKTGTHLGRAVESFNNFSRTYDGNVMSRARRLTEKHIKIGKRQIVDDIPLVESAPRYNEAVEDAGDG